MNINKSTTTCGKKYTKNNLPRTDHHPMVMGRAVDNRAMCRRERQANPVVFAGFSSFCGRQKLPRKILSGFQNISGVSPGAERRWVLRVTVFCSRGVSRGAHPEFKNISPSHPQKIFWLSLVGVRVFPPQVQYVTSF